MAEAGARESVRLRDNFEVVPPYELIATDDRYPTPEAGIALCLSGGGYKATLFHLGALLRLNDACLLPKLTRITSVSGGSILAATLGVKWSRLKFDASGRCTNIQKIIVGPVRKFTAHTTDYPAVLFRLLGAKYHLNYFRMLLDFRLLGFRTLQALPDTPRFVITAANVQSAALFRFMKPRIRDWRVGDIGAPRTLLSFAVMASAAYPPYLSPLVMRTNPSAFAQGSGYDLKQAEYRRRIFLTDAGVYDNLGIETAWKKYDTVLISDAGYSPLPRAEPSTGWYGHIVRVFELVAHQSLKLRKRQVIESFKLRRSMTAAGIPEEDTILRKFSRKGAYWGIRSDVRRYGLTRCFDVPIAEAQRLADLPVRLARISRNDQDRLIDWGYAVCDAAIRRHYLTDDTPPTSAPFQSFHLSTLDTADLT